MCSVNSVQTVCILILCTVVGVHFQFLKRAGNHLSTVKTPYTFESEVLFAGSRANVADLVYGLAVNCTDHKERKAVL